MSVHLTLHMRLYKCNNFVTSYMKKQPGFVSYYEFVWLAILIINVYVACEDYMCLF